MIEYTLSKMSRRDLEGLTAREDVDLTEAMTSACEIIEQVRKDGDEALLRYAIAYESFSGKNIRVPPSEIRASRGRVPRELMDSLSMCRDRIERYHANQQLRPFEFKDDCGSYGQRVVPLERIGAYVPGGTASYASSVLMACVPAKVAGVGEIALCTPGNDGKVDDAILAAASICDVSEVYAIGGAQAIAAMAYGTETIRRVQKIVGPGGAFVTAAKILVRNDCEIDFLAGPSEVLIIADDSADPESIALEMLAQLEHDPLARALLVSTSRQVVRDSKKSLEALIPSADRESIVRRSSAEGAIFINVRNMSEALELSNSYAPEHLVMFVRSPKSALSSIRNAGSVFLGMYSSVAFGDYCAGTNHILPTKGVSSVKSSLSTYDFLKIIPYQRITATGAARLAPATAVIAGAEGLPAHAQAASSRCRRKGR